MWELVLEYIEYFDLLSCTVFLFRGKSGSKTFVAKRFLPRGGKEKEGVTTKEVNSTYFWTPLVKLDFSVGVVVPVAHADDQLSPLQIPVGKFCKITLIKFVSSLFICLFFWTMWIFGFSSTGYKFNYHRIDLIHPGEPCSHFGSNATKGKATVHLPQRFPNVLLNETFSLKLDLFALVQSDGEESKKVDEFLWCAL